jgi:hypothetical protein
VPAMEKYSIYGKHTIALLFYYNSGNIVFVLPNSGKNAKDNAG